MCTGGDYLKNADSLVMHLIRVKIIHLIETRNMITILTYYMSKLSRLRKNLVQSSLVMFYLRLICFPSDDIPSTVSMQYLMWDITEIEQNALDKTVIASNDQYLIHLEFYLLINKTLGSILDPRVDC